MYKAHRCSDDLVMGFFPKVGDRVPRHAHDRPHETGVDTGAILLRMWSIWDETVVIEARLSAGCHVTVPAEWKHEIEALEPNTHTYCAFARVGADPSGSHQLEAEGAPWR